MGRQTQLHVFSKDVNDLLVAMHDKETLEIALRSGSTANPERLAFIPENMNGQTLVLWSDRFAPNLQRGYVANAQPPYYRIDAQTELVLELWLSALTTWDGKPALTQGRIYGIFESKQPEFEKVYERLVRYIRRHWRKNPASWMQGYIGPAASDWFEQRGILLPNYIPPVRSDWIACIREQHPQ